MKKYCSLIAALVVLAFPVAYQRHVAGQLEQRRAEALAGRQAGNHQLSQDARCAKKAPAPSKPACSVKKERGETAPKACNAIWAPAGGSKATKKCPLCIEAQHLAAIQCGITSLAAYDTRATRQPITSPIVHAQYILFAKSRDPPEAS
ncbi:hypothetical protein [Fundidesulfovibrio agrisoli]|uniref:hypothetical protein n=1 Tax=Fundidesulfovibrio agrisoli TaxID=2922717 RepID=UPI001FAB717C|nr:hypothetical protein [Fundidesulfovibrio agrisoli]